MISCKNSSNIDSVIDWLVKHSKSMNWFSAPVHFNLSFMNTGDWMKQMEVTSAVLSNWVYWSVWLSSFSTWLQLHYLLCWLTSWVLLQSCLDVGTRWFLFLVYILIGVYFNVNMEFFLCAFEWNSGLMYSALDEFRFLSFWWWMSLFQAGRLMGAWCVWIRVLCLSIRVSCLKVCLKKIAILKVMFWIRVFENWELGEGLGSMMVWFLVSLLVVSQ